MLMSGVGIFSLGEPFNLQNAPLEDSGGAFLWFGFGGRCEIRTREAIHLPVFKTGTINHSVNLPEIFYHIGGFSGV